MKLLPKFNYLPVDLRRDPPILVVKLAEQELILVQTFGLHALISLI